MNRIFLTIVLFNLCFSSCIKENSQKDFINGEGKDNLSYVNSFIGSTGPTDSDYGGTIDGKPLNEPFIEHEVLVSSENIVFEMSETPTEWGQ